MIVLSGISLYRGSLNRDFVPSGANWFHTFYIGNIVISKIVISEFHCTESNFISSAGKNK